KMHKSDGNRVEMDRHKAILSAVSCSFSILTSESDGGPASREVIASLDNGGRESGEEPMSDGERESDPHQVVAPSLSFPRLAP
ncbi:MAG TPA: hypothetical protein VHM67_11810, partial [Gemmatimonadaceae bacterium]|nr:hypothetical protein [Gemmatimonadaceae bacterium]